MLKSLWMACRLIWMGANTAVLRILVLSGAALGIIAGAATYLSTYYLSKLVKVVTEQNFNLVTHYLYLLIAAAAAIVFARFAWRYMAEYAGTPITINIRKHYYRTLFHKDYDWHQHNSVGFFSSMLNRAIGFLDTWNWKMPYEYLPDFFLGLFFFGYTWTVSPWLFVYFVSCTIVLVLIILKLYVRRALLIHERNLRDSKFTKIFVDFLYNIRSVKKMNLLKFTTEKIDEKADSLIDKTKEMMRYNSYQWGIMEFFVRAQFLIPLAYFIYRLIQTGSGIEIVVMLAAIQGRMEEIGRQIMHFISDLAISQQAFELLEQHVGSAGDTDARRRLRNWHEISFKNTVFHFKRGRQNFEHYVPDFTINRGDHVAVMGKSGEGKSTFLNLLTRNYSPESGTISVDGRDYADINQSFFDHQMTYVSQDIELFDLSLYDNLTMGKRVGAAELAEIIDGCCLNELIKRMHGDMNAEIGEKGVKVSGGEKQRINLARGLLLDRDILVLDEITANLDPATTAKIWQFIFSKYKNKTIIAISHEPELLKHVNKRIVFHGGRGIAG